MNPPPVKVIYHSPCLDGFGAAWCFHHFFNRTNDHNPVSFHPAVYGDEPPDVSGCLVYIVDFSYPLEVLEVMAREQAARIHILDHHKSFAEIAEAAGRISGVTVDLDMARSGAMLAWDHLFSTVLGREEPPKL